MTRFEQGENEEALAEDFAGLLQEAQEYTDRDAYLSALDLYGVAFDGRLALPEQLKSLEPLLDQILIDALPALDLVLGEASSLIYTNLPNPDTFAT